jgi:hypothetical protein
MPSAGGRDGHGIVHSAYRRIAERLDLPEIDPVELILQRRLVIKNVQNLKKRLGPEPAKLSVTGNPTALYPESL